MSEHKTRVMTAVRELLPKTVYLDYWGHKIQRKGPYVEAHELYRDNRLGLSERDVFAALNGLVSDGVLEIHDLKYWVKK